MSKNMIKIDFTKKKRLLYNLLYSRKIIIIYVNKIINNINYINSIHLFIETFNNDILANTLSLNEVNDNIITESKIRDTVKEVFRFIKDSIIKFGKMIGRFISESIENIKKFFMKSKKETQEKVKEIKNDNRKKINPAKAMNQENIQIKNTQIKDNEKTDGIYKKVELPKNSKDPYKNILKKSADLLNTANIKQIKYALVDSLDIDPTFERYETFYNTAKQRGLIEPHEELTPFYLDSQLEKMSEEELEDYWESIKNDLLKNFSDERMQTMKRIAKIIYKNKIQRIKKDRAERRKYEEDSSLYNDLKYINYAALIRKLYNSMNSSFSKDINNIIISGININKVKNKEDKIHAMSNIYIMIK